MRKERETRKAGIFRQMKKKEGKREGRERIEEERRKEGKTNRGSETKIRSGKFWCGRKEIVK